MATGKKYYWIKLRKDFMSGDTVDFLMSQKNGAQYVVLYQMLCLMCINTKGRLSRQIGEMIIPFDVDKIQRDCKYFSRDTVTIALGLFKKLGLIYEQSEGSLFISDFEDLIGSETDFAKQKRMQRKSGQDQRLLQDNSMDSHADKKMDKQADSSMDISEDNVHSNVSEQSIQSIEKEIRDKSKDIRDKNSITVSNETVCWTDIQHIVEVWNELQSYGIKPIVKLDSGSKRYQSLVARVKQYGTDDVLSAIEKIKSSNFLQGKTRSGWTITFDWFVRPNNFPKVLEGNYDNKVLKENDSVTTGRSDDNDPYGDWR